MPINILSPKWWISTAVQTFVIMVFIYLIKDITEKFNIPVVSTIAERV